MKPEDEDDNSADADGGKNWAAPPAHFTAIAARLRRETFAPSPLSALGRGRVCAGVKKRI